MNSGDSRTASLAQDASGGVLAGHGDDAGRQQLLEALAAARDVIVSLQTRRLGYVPAQRAYSTRMTDMEMEAARAVVALDRIIQYAAGKDAAEGHQPDEGTSGISQESL